MPIVVAMVLHQENPRNMMPHPQRSIGKMGRDVAWDLKTSVCGSIRNYTNKGNQLLWIFHLTWVVSLVSWENTAEEPEVQVKNHGDHNVNLSNNDSSSCLLATLQLPSVCHIFHYVVCLAFPIASFIPWTQQQYPWMHMIRVYSNNTDSGNNNFVACFKEDSWPIQHYKWYKSVSSSSKFGSQKSDGTLLGEKMIFLCKWQVFNVGRLIEVCNFLFFNTATQPFFIFGYGKAIHRMGLDGKNQRRLVAGVGRSIFLDFHFRDDTIYWADKQTGVIYKAAVRDAQRQVINQTNTILKCLLKRGTFSF